MAVEQGTVQPPPSPDKFLSEKIARRHQCPWKLYENLKDEFKLQISPQKKEAALIFFDKLIKNDIGTNEVESWQGR